MPLCINNNNEGAAKRCLVCSLVGVVFVWVLELIVGVCGAFSDLAVWKAPHFSELRSSSVFSLFDDPACALKPRLVNTIQWAF